MLTALFLTLLVAPAQAAPPISSGATVLIGTGATFDENPATMVVQIQGELPLVVDESVGLGVILPLELTMSGRESFGVSTTNSMITLVPSVRVRALNTSPVRLYADAGAGVAHITARSDGWLFDATTTRTGWATRLVAGLEVGPPEGGVAVVVEPLGFDTLHFESRHTTGYTARIGVGVRY